MAGKQEEKVQVQFNQNVTYGKEFYAAGTKAEVTEAVKDELSNALVIVADENE